MWQKATCDLKDMISCGFLHPPFFDIKIILYSYIGMKVLLARHRLFCSTKNPSFLFLLGCKQYMMELEQKVLIHFSGARIQGQCQSRSWKYFVSISSIQKSKGYNSSKFKIQKENLLEFVEHFRSKVYRAGINRSYDSLIKKNHKKRYVAAILKGLRIIEVMSKPNDLKQK